MNTDLDVPNVLLQGGPAGAAPAQDRLVRLDDAHEREKVVLHLGNRYEHFESTGERTVRDGRELWLFRWAGRTFVAE